MIEIANQQTTLSLDEERLRRAAELVLADAGIREGNISLAVVDDPTIHELNRQYLNHDYPTDVLSFLLEEGDKSLEGEVIVSADTAAASAGRYGWSAHDELLLYVLHGMLHLVGYDDLEPDERTEMRSRERAYLARFGLEYRFDETAEEGPPFLRQSQGPGGNA
jgi:probable rRNA maturation factor